MERIVRNFRPVLYKKGEVEFLRKQLFLAFNKDVMFFRLQSSCDNGQEAACHPGKSKCFESVDREMAQSVMCSRKAHVF